MVAGASATAKPHVRVGGIGDYDHGKTTLAAALLMRSAARFNPGLQVKSSAVPKPGCTRRRVTQPRYLSRVSVA
jgi:translation elongation factor EF-Tu-like GTPase